MPITITGSKGRVKHPILTRKFQFPARKVYKLKRHLYDHNYPVVDLQEISNDLEKYKDWDMTKTQFRNLLNRVHYKSILMRVDTYFDGMVDMVVKNEGAEFHPMTVEDVDRIVAKLTRYSPYRVTFNTERQEIELWSLAVGGYTFKFDPEQFDKEFRGQGL